MRQPIAIVSAAAWLALAGCATDATIRPHAATMAGTYYSGDGLGRNITVVLNPDGTFTGEWEGCLGPYGQANGNWQRHGDELLFFPTEERELLAGHLRRAMIISHAGRQGFAREEDVEHGRIDEQLVFFLETPEQ